MNAPIEPKQCNLTENRTVIIIDGMDILDQLKKVKPMMNVGHLLNAFMSKLTSELDSISQNYAEFRLLFTRFVSNSLKESRTNCKTLRKAIIHYHVMEKTPIKKLETCLAHIDTRVELTEFLGKKVLESITVPETRIVVGYGNKFYSNDAHHFSDILNQDHKLADMPQLILLNSIDLKNNGVQTVFVKSLSIDTLVVLLGHKNLIPSNNNILRCDQNIKIDDFSNRIGAKLSDALIGWYAMQVCIEYKRDFFVGRSIVKFYRPKVTILKKN